MQDFISIATHLADEARLIARKYFRTPFDIDSKGDSTPVTIADQEIERALRAILQQKRPDDTILGEEFDTKTGSSAYTWVIDPIDGTQSFIMGRPTFGTLIALCEGDTPVLGLIDQPISDERWIGVRGQVTTFNGVPVTTRKTDSLHGAVATSTTPAMFTGAQQNLTKPFEGVCKYGWGGDCYSYGLLASGHIDLIIEADMKPHDFAALVPVVEGAGGHISDFQGGKITLQSRGEIIAAGNPDLWPSIQNLLRAKTL